MTDFSLTPREKVLLLGRGISIGTTCRTDLCYVCDGGASKEYSFAVTRQDKDVIAYKCHRASCGWQGYEYLDGSGAETFIPISQFHPNPYKGTIVPLEVEDLDWLEKKYDIDLEYVIKAGWARAIEPGFALVLPVISPKGDVRGIVLRRINESGKKEIKTYKVMDEPWLCWYRTAVRDIVVVEDQISALKAARFTTSCALLGTGLSQNKVDEIKKVAGKTGKIWIAFDPDAREKALEYLKQYRMYCGGNLYALMLSKDLKDMSYSEIAKFGTPFSNAIS
jgi:hypothetical protein